MMPSLPHFIYIPAILGIGFYLGWLGGSRGVQKLWDREEAKRLRRENEE